MTDPHLRISRDSEPAPGDPPAGPGQVLTIFEGFVEDLRHRTAGDPPAIAATLEIAYEELRVTVEHLRSTSTQLMETRAQVEAAERRYRDLFEEAPDPYLVTDLGGVVREANRAACAALNIDHRYLVGKPLT